MTLRRLLGLADADGFIAELWVRNHRIGRPPIGEIAGPCDPGWPRDYYALRCQHCGATWTGVVGEVCGWCEAAEEYGARRQAELDEQRRREVRRDVAA
jgi:hypothetical protein